MSEPPRFLQWLIRMYPLRHRREYGAEMWAVVRHRFAHARSGRAVTTAGAARDLIGGAAGTWMDRFRRSLMGLGKGWGIDTRFVARSLWRSRGYALTVIVVLACAVAANATVYSFVRGTLLVEAPYPEPERVVIAWGSNLYEGQRRDVISGPNFIDMRREATSLESMAAIHYDDTYILVDGRPQVMGAVEVTVDFLEVLGVTPALGRDFGNEDRTSSAPPVVMVSYGFWRDHLEADPGWIGRPLPIEGEPRTVIGVLPEGFEFIAPAPLFTPLRDDELAARERYNIHFHVLGRLAPGASAQDATRELSAITARIAEVHTGFRDWTVLVEPLRDVSVAAVRPVIWTLSATVLLVLLVALTNLATLFRIRTITRADELALRVALGSGWARVARVLSLETVGLAGAGALLGLAVTPLLLRRVAALLPVRIPIPESAVRLPVLQAVLDPVVIAIAIGSALLGALILTVPGFLGTAWRVRPGSGTRVHRGSRGTRVLVGIELAAATVLCIGAGLTTRTAQNMLATDVGVRDEQLLTMYFGDVWDEAPAVQVDYFRRVVERVEAVSGVQRAGVIDYIDFEAEDDYARVYFLDRAFQPVSSIREEWRRIDHGLFEAAGMDIRMGGGFTASDFVGDPRSAVINESFALKHYPGGDAVGQYVSLSDEGYRDLRIAGVVGDVRSLGPATPPPPMIYVPNQATPRGTQGLYVRVAGDPISYADAVRDAIWSVDSSQPIAQVAPMTALVGSWVAIPRATRTLVAMLAALAAMLAAVGIFGVVSLAVRSRGAELGVRLALGASPARLERDQLAQVVPIIATGVCTGIAGGWLAALGARGLLFGVSPLDPWSILAALTVMVSATLLATYLPARRIGRIDPTEVMRAR